MQTNIIIPGALCSSVARPASKVRELRPLAEPMGSAAHGEEHCQQMADWLILVQGMP